MTQGSILSSPFGTARLVDLSQPVSNDMALWNGSEATAVKLERLDLDHCVPGGEIRFTRLSMVSHSGTHVDAARHFFPDGRAIDQYDIRRFVCGAVAVDARRDGIEALTRAQLERAAPEIRPGDAVLIYFGYARRFGLSDYYYHPYLAHDAARYLVERGAAIVGVDTLTPDKPAVARPARAYDFPVHRALLQDDILVIENLGPALEQLVGRRFVLIATPFRIVGGDASPVAPLAIVEGDGGERWR